MASRTLLLSLIAICALVHARSSKKRSASVVRQKTHATEPTLVSAVLSRNDTALVIVDPQVDFTQPNGALPCIDTGPDSNLWPEIAALQAKHFASVFVTRDWHPEDHVSFARNHPGKVPFDVILVNVTSNKFGPHAAVAVYNQTLWPAHCAQGTPGSEFACPIDLSAITVTKGTYLNVDSYSGFGDGVSFHASYPKAKETSILKGELDKRGVRNLVVCGLATDYCVRATALDGLAYGFNVTLVKGACRGVNNQTIASALAEMAAAGVIIVETAADVILQ